MHIPNGQVLRWPRTIGILIFYYAVDLSYYAKQGNYKVLVLTVIRNTKNNEDTHIR